MPGKVSLAVFFVKVIFSKMALLLTLFLVNLLAVNDARAALDYSRLHSKYVTDFYSEIQRESTAGASDRYYSTSYYLQGMLSAAEALEDQSALRRTTQILDKMLDLTSDLDGDGNREWKPLDPNGRPYQLYMYQALGPFARAAAIINRSKWKTAFEGEARRYIEFVDGHVVKFWYDKVYQRRKIPCSGSVGWDDKCSLMALIMTSLYEATGRALYRELAVKTGESFKKGLTLSGNGWLWDNGTIVRGYDGNNAGVPDTSHANREAMMMVAMHEIGLVFNRDEVLRMAATFSDVIWNGSSTDPLFANYINGSNVAFRGRKQPGSNGAVYLGWIMVGRHSQRAHEAGDSLLRGVVENRSNPSIDVNATGYGKVALTGHMLRNFLRRSW